VAVNDSCRRCREWVSLELDVGLSEFERALMSRHLAGCPECSDFAGGVRETTELLRRVAPAQPSRSYAVARRRRLPLAVRAAPVAAAIVATLATLTATRLVGTTTHSPAGTRLTPAGDLASMRQTRRQQLLPSAADAAYPRIRVIEID
jgi:predicted anti-sigma-YlaC factor YlaD